MAGIYLHIPFCQTRCVYCDFYSTTRTELRPRYVRALCRELRERSSYFRGQPVRTVYLGGGTPSQLAEPELEFIFHTLEATFGLGSCEEITLEANPDDLTADYIHMLARRTPINRVSIGLQTLHEPTLRLLRRRHTARQALEAVTACRAAGLSNLSIDLIYGLPGETDEQWADDLRQVLNLDVDHISAYHLTYEEGTDLHLMRQRGQVHEVDEESSLRQFTMLVDTLTAAGYEHYEISNFCRPGHHSLHNSAYWQGVPYLGCGPSAHSFDGESREWNVADLQAYILGMENGHRPYERELLSLTTRYNECVMTALRTASGLDLTALQQAFGPELHRYCLRLAAPHIRSGRLQATEDGHLRLTRQGIFISDGIIADLMALNEK